MTVAELRRALVERFSPDAEVLVAVEPEGMYVGISEFEGANGSEIAILVSEYHWDRRQVLTNAPDWRE